MYDNNISFSNSVRLVRIYLFNAQPNIPTMVIKAVFSTYILTTQTGHYFMPYSLGVTYTRHLEVYRAV